MSRFFHCIYSTFIRQEVWQRCKETVKSLEEHGLIVELLYDFWFVISDTVLVEHDADLCEDVYRIVENETQIISGPFPWPPPTPQPLHTKRKGRLSRVGLRTNCYRLTDSLCITGLLDWVKRLGIFFFGYVMSWRLTVTIQSFQLSGSLKYSYTCICSRHQLKILGTASQCLYI